MSQALSSYANNPYFQFGFKKFSVTADEPTYKVRSLKN